MSDIELRRRLGWLIGIRAIIVTLLLGGATSAQLAAPGLFPVDPFFFLIALTYGLTAVYALTLSSSIAISGSSTRRWRSMP
jgi:hypothetical protein